MAALTDAERVDVRRFCGYPAYGTGPNDDSFQRYFVEYLLLEYRSSNLTDAELAVARVYLTQLTALETGIIGAADNLDTDQAAVWKRNANEVRDRSRLFDDWRRRLCSFLGIPPGPAFAGSTGIRMVV